MVWGPICVPARSFQPDCFSFPVRVEDRNRRVGRPGNFQSARTFQPENDFFPVLPCALVNLRIQPHDEIFFFLRPCPFDPSDVLFPFGRVIRRTVTHQPISPAFEVIKDPEVTPLFFCVTVEWGNLPAIWQARRHAEMHRAVRLLLAGFILQRMESRPAIQIQGIDEAGAKFCPFPECLIDRERFLKVQRTGLGFQPVRISKFDRAPHPRRSFQKDGTYSLVGVFDPAFGCAVRSVLIKFDVHGERMIRSGRRYRVE